jgi:heme exporter protein D
MSDFFAMGGYGAYVWWSYAVFFVVLIADALAPTWQRRKILRELHNRLKRQAARKPT